MNKKSANFIWILVISIVLAFIIGLFLPSPWIESELKHFLGKGIWVKDTTGMLIPGGYVYEGTVSIINEKPQGYGVMKGRNATYIGQWADGMIIKGKKTDSISSYEGEFNENFEKNGFGILRFTPQHIAFLKNKGVSSNKIIEEYIGNWTNNKKSGLGRLVMADTTMVFGYFSNDKYLKVEGAAFAVGSRVYGIDVSHYQEKIDWSNLALYCNSQGTVSEEISSSGKYLQPVFFAFIKSTDGTRIKDRYFMTNFTMAGKHGITRGVYHFFRSKEDTQKQILNFTENTVWFPGDLPPVLDMELEEEIKSLGSQTYLERALEWLEGVEVIMGVKPMIYTSYFIYNRYLKNDIRFAGFKFWIARYNPSPPDFKGWDFWQFSGHGHAQGIEGFVDLDLYCSTYKDFLKKFSKNQKD